MSPHEAARALLAEGRLDQAETACSALLRAESRDAEALHVMGLIRYGQQRLDEAAFLLAASADLAGDSSARSDLAVVQLAQGQAREAIASLERALQADPGNAPGWCLLGYAYERLDDRPTAIRCFTRATQLDDRNADAYVHLASLRAAEGQTEEAIRGYRAAIAADPDQPEGWRGLGALLEDAEALACAETAARLRPEDPDVLAELGQARRRLDRPDEAVAAYEAALALAPARQDIERSLGAALMDAVRPLDAAERFARGDGDEARFDRALALLSAGDLGQGFELFEARLSIPAIMTPRHEETPRWNGEDPRGQTILVYEEQGLGDTIQFLRYVRLLADAGAKVVTEVNPVLLELAQTLRGAGKVIMTGEKAPRCRFQSPVMSLARGFGTTLPTIPGVCPYLRAPPTRARSWAHRLPDPQGRLRVGIAWSGNPAHRNDRRRSMPLAALAPLLARTDCVFHVLQTEIREADRPWLAAHREVSHPAWQFVDVSDAAAAAAMMDVVVSVDTAVAHLAGALAVPVLVLLPYAADWRWLMDREDSPWYPSARLFRQRRPGEWGEVIERVAAALDALV